MNQKPARHTADERRAEITAAAAIEFARRGLDGATTDRIAERAGVSQPYVVRLFGTKKALFLAVANRAFERIAEAFRTSRGRRRPRAAPRTAWGWPTWRCSRIATSSRSSYSSTPRPTTPRSEPAWRRASRSCTSSARELSGADPDQLRAFIAQGMLCNVAAALDIPQIAWDENWARERLAEVETAPTDES